MEEFSAKKASRFKVLTVLAITVTLSLGAFMYSAVNVELEIDGKTKEITTYASTVDDLLKEEEILLDKLAYINLPLDTKLEDNMKIIIKMPKPYTLTVGEDMVEVKSIYTRVEDILKDLNVDLGDLDYTKPKLEDEVAYGSEIAIVKVKEEIEEVEEVIPHDSMVKKTDRLNRGTTNIAQKGKDGLKVKRIKNRFENNKLISSELVEEEVAMEPIPEIIEKGTKVEEKSVAKTSRGNLRYKKVITMVATAYDNSYESTGKHPGEKYWGLTASGTKARVGAVAVDPRVIPLGTKLYVESLDGTKDYGFCVAEDTGGAIKGNKIDLFFNTAGEVRNFGRRKVRVYIVE